MTNLSQKNERLAVEDLAVLKAGEADADEICAISWAASEHDVARGYPPQWITPGDENIKTAIEKRYMRKLVLDNQTVGCFSIHDTDEALWGPSESTWYLHCMTVAVPHQGKGFGTLAVRYVEELASENKIAAVRLDVPVTRDLTCNWYKKLHYVERDVVQPPTYRRPAMLLEKVLRR